MGSAEDLSDEEKRAYDLIVSNEGMFQSEMWKALDATSRKGSKLAMALEEMGLIERETATKDGQRTYFLLPIEEAPAEEAPEEEPEPEEEPRVDTAELEDRAFALIRDRGGIYQSQLWKELDVSSRKGSRIAMSLAEDDRIRRQSATYNGQRTYLLLPPKQELDFSLLMAGDMISPLVGEEGTVDPTSHDMFSRWILELAQKRR